MSDSWKRLSQTFHDVVSYARAQGVSEEILRKRHYRLFHEAALNGALPGVTFVNGRWWGRTGMEAEMAKAFGLMPVAVSRAEPASTSAAA